MGYRALAMLGQTPHKKGKRMDLANVYGPIIWTLNLRGVPAGIFNLGGSCDVLLVRRHGWSITIGSTGIDGLEADFSGKWDWEVMRTPTEQPEIIASHKIIKRRTELGDLIDYIRSEMDRSPKFWPVP